MTVNGADLTIRWIGQSGYILRDGESEICIDPYLSDVVERVAGRVRLQKAPLKPGSLQSDAVICTHDHLDHLDTDAIPLMKKEIHFYAPTAAQETLRACGVANCHLFDEGETCHIGSFRITAVYACHSVPAIGLLVRHGDLTLYFSGDTEYDPRLLSLSEEKIDIMFICINGRLGNMNIEDAVRLTAAIRPRVAIPTHYGMFASNTEDPAKYTNRLPYALALAYDREYTVEEIMKNV